MLAYSPMTKAQKAKYLNDPSRCPACNGEYMTAESGVEFDSRSCWRDIACATCGFIFVEVYTLAAIEDKR